MAAEATIPSVSVVIPTFNRSRLVRRAVDSALAQSLRCDVIVVDHGSSDATNDTIKAYGDDVQFLRLDQDYGPVFSWLHGCLHARTEWIKFIADDDWIDESFVEKAMALASAEVGFVLSQVEILDWETQSRVSSMFGFGGQTSGTYSVKSWIGNSVRRTMVSPSAMLVRRKDIIDALYVGRLPLQDESFFGAGPDHLIKLLCMIRYPRFGYLAEPLTYFGHHSGSITVEAKKNDESFGTLKATYREVDDYVRMVMWWKTTEQIRGIVSRLRKIWKRFANKPII